MPLVTAKIGFSAPDTFDLDVLIRENVDAIEEGFGTVAEFRRLVLAGDPVHLGGGAAPLVTIILTPGAAPSAPVPVAAPSAAGTSSLQTIYKSFHAPTFAPEVTHDGPIPSDVADRHAAGLQQLKALTPAIVIAAGRRAIAFHKSKQAEIAAEIAARTARNGNEVLNDEARRLLAHHFTQIEGIAAQLAALEAPQKQAAE